MLPGRARGAAAVAGGGDVAGWLVPLALGACCLLLAATEPGARWTQTAVETASAAAPEWLVGGEVVSASAASSEELEVEALQMSEEERVQGRKKNLFMHR